MLHAGRLCGGNKQTHGVNSRCELRVQLVYHLPRSQRHPQGLEVRVPRSFDEFLDILVDKFPHEEEGIRGFYGECWTVRAAQGC